jgi:hypothetical protein
LSYCPRSSLPADVLAWLARRLAHLTPPRPPGRGGTPPLALEVRLDAVAAVILDGLSYRRAGRTVGISKTEVGDSVDLLLGQLGALGFCQPDGTFITTLDQLQQRLGRWPRSARRYAWTGWPPGCNDPPGGPTSRCWTTPSATSWALWVWRCRASTATCRGATGLAGQLPRAGAAGAVGAWWGAGRRRGGHHSGPRVPGHGEGSRALACAGWGSADLGLAHRQAAGVQPPPGRAAGAGGAGDRPSGRRVGVAPLARATVPGPGCLPGRWRAGVPQPLAAPGLRLNEHHGHPQ